MRLYDTKGNRLYLTMQERAAFFEAARIAPPGAHLCRNTGLYGVPSL